jgi:hypothetical protein
MISQLVPGNNFVLGGLLPQDWAEIRHSRLEASDTALRHYDVSHIGSDPKTAPWVFIGETCHSVVSLKDASGNRLMFVFSVEFEPGTATIIRTEFVRLCGGN